MHAILIFAKTFLHSSLARIWTKEGIAPFSDACELYVQFAF